LIAFYDIGLGEGLPFNSDGQPTRTDGLKRSDFVAAFKKDSSEWVCVLCQGYLSGLQVDHWIAKSHFPNLTVAADNLLPICGECNSTECKGRKLTLSPGMAQPFDHWFHPYYRTAHDKVRVNFSDGKVQVEAQDPQYALHVRNFVALVKLEDRWTNNFRMYYGGYKRDLAAKLRHGRIPRTLEGVRAGLLEFLQEINVGGTRKHHQFVQKLVVESALQPARLEAWLVELEEAASPVRANEHLTH
jgi:hypothetical protein